MTEYLELEKVLDDSHIITVQTRDYGSLEVVPVEYLANLPTVELQTIKDVVVPNLEKHNIKRAYPDMTDGEVAAYILGFNEHEKLNKGHCYIDNEGYERCSVCNEHETGMRYFSFCPRCGVRFTLKG